MRSHRNLLAVISKANGRRRRSVIAHIRSTGATSLAAIAEALNKQGIPAPSGRVGSRWHATTVA